MASVTPAARTRFHGVLRRAGHAHSGSTAAFPAPAERRLTRKADGTLPSFAPAHPAGRAHHHGGAAPKAIARRAGDIGNTTSMTRRADRLTCD